MAEGVLHSADGLAVFQAVDRKRVPEGHGGDGLEDSRGAVCLANDHLNDPSAEVRTGVPALKDIVVSRTTCLAQREYREEIRGNMQHPLPSQRPACPQASGGSVDVSPPQAAQFADFEAATVEQAEHELITRARGGGQKRERFLAAENLRQRVWALGCYTPRGNGTAGKLVENVAQDRDVHSQPVPGGVGVYQPGQVALDDGFVDLHGGAPCIAVKAS